MRDGVRTEVESDKDIELSSEKENARAVTLPTVILRLAARVDAAK